MHKLNSSREVTPARGWQESSASQIVSELCILILISVTPQSKTSKEAFLRSRNSTGTPWEEASQRQGHKQTSYAGTTTLLFLESESKLTENDWCSSRIIQLSGGTLVFLESEWKLSENYWPSSRIIQLSGALPCGSFLSAATVPSKMPVLATHAKMFSCFWMRRFS